MSALFSNTPSVRHFPPPLSSIRDAVSILAMPRIFDEVWYQ